MQVFQIEKREFLLIGQPEGHVQHALLRFGQFQKAAQQQRPHLGNCGSDRMALFAKEIPKYDGKSLILQVQPNDGGAIHERFMQFVLGRARLRNPSQVALHIGHEYGHTGGRKSLGQDLQGHRLARARRSGDQSMAIAIFQQKGLRCAVAFAPPTHENRVRHNRPR